MNTGKSRLLVVDDSATVRAVLRRVLTLDGDIEVVGEAASGPEAIEAAARLDPDAIIMDLDLPGMDGLAASREILRRRNTPIVVVTSADGAHRAHVAAAFQTMASSMVNVFGKPQVPEEWKPLGAILRDTVRGLGRSGGAGSKPASVDLTQGLVTRRRLDLIAIAASTGGPMALRELLAAFERRCPAPVAVVQHIAAGFEEGLAEWLAAETGLDVGIARQGEVLHGNRVRIAPSGTHLCVDVGLVVRLDGRLPPVKSHRPSATVLFRSLGWMAGERVAAAVLTGMGDDGVDGLLELKERGALTFAQDASSSMLYGMPRAAAERGAAEHLLSPGLIGQTLAHACDRGGP